MHYVLQCIISRKLRYQYLNFQSYKRIINKNNCLILLCITMKFLFLTPALEKYGLVKMENA